MSIDVIHDVPDACLDIVFVPGLKVDQEDWTSAEDSVFWPKHLLASRVPMARILAFKYDGAATVDAFWNEKNVIAEKSDDLVDNLMKKRHAKIASRATGSLCRTLPWGVGRREIPSASDLGVLSRHVLAIPQEFAQFRRASSVNIETFHESSPVHINGQAVKIVEDFVARLPGGSPNPIKMEGNHHEISRLDNENRDFNFLMKYLAQAEVIGVMPYFKSNNHGMQMAVNSGSINGPGISPRNDAFFVLKDIPPRSPVSAEGTQ
ncbi:hypothetical protein N7451_002249 [Penicillium sp. IBT 35674x]|nr:hypothetical protein N7451_002249 [Penicillium sp. IBT 35674x]